MDSLRVNLGTLGGLEKKMAQIPEKMSSTGRKLGQHADDVGSSTVVAALEDFESHWGDGRKKIRKKAEALGSMLRDTVTEIGQTDEDLKKSLATSATSKQVTHRGQVS